MPSRKSSRNHNDYPASTSSRGYSNGGYTYPIVPGQPMHYGSYNPYGTADRRQFSRDGLYNYDPYRRGEYAQSHNGAGGPGVEDKWRNTYPYVPTSYYYHSPPPRPPPESIDLETEGGEDERENWGSKWEFIFSCVGLSVGIGNVWRFPTLAYENGGGSFLIPYFILLLFIGKPMYYMELALGQFAQRGPVSVWKLCPLGQGVGIAQCVVSCIVAIYYNVIMAYCLFYIFSSFAEEVPWSKCSKEWGYFADIESDDHCYEWSEDNTTATCAAADGKCESSAKQYYDKVVLGIDKAILSPTAEWTDDVTKITNETYALTELGKIGDIKWDITLCLLLSWIVVFACLVKGIKSSGKVVYFTATFPYLLLIILLVYGCTLDGALDGVKELFIPKKWSGEKSIQDPQVWRKAAEQMFFSLSVSWGGLIMFGSYNKFHHKVHVTATVISSLDFVTSIIAGVVIFSILGALSKETGVPLSEIVEGGQGLAFIAYPTALARLPVPQVWSIMFFFMLFLLGLDSEFALLETVLTAFYDGIPTLKRFKPIMTFLLCMSCFLISLPCMSYSGAFVFQIMDEYGGGMSVMWIAIFEVIGIMWFYGANNFAKDLNFMLNISIEGCWAWFRHYFMVVIWTLIPILLILILGVSLANWEQPDYADKIKYPDWIHGIGYFLILIAAAQIPIWALFMTLYYLCAPSKRVSDVVRPTADWGPGDKQARKMYQANKAARHKGHLHGYENPAMAYPYYNYAGYHSYHM
jgi:solute carrier family 6 amino acid transporter-like protein 5/7/9/14